MKQKQQLQQNKNYKNVNISIESMPVAFYLGINSIWHLKGIREILRISRPLRYQMEFIPK